MLVGWSAPKIVSYVFDDRDRVIGERITEEPEWDRAGFQAELMMALAEVERDICPGCGGWLSVTTVPDHGHRVDSVQCLQCQAIEIYNEQKDKDDATMATVSTTSDRPGARRVRVQPIPLPEA